MKKLLPILILIFVQGGVYGQTNTPSSDQNYIETVTYTAPTTDDTKDPQVAIDSIVYYDGLGRPMQVRALRAGGNGQDIVTPIVYDKFGRHAKRFLPYADPNGSATGSSAAFADNDNVVIPALFQYYQNRFPDEIDPQAPNPFSKLIYDGSPLDRVTEKAFPGEAWKALENSQDDHTVKKGYQTNTAADGVIRLTADFPDPINPESPELTYHGNWGAGQLHKKTTKDENWQPGQTYPHNHTTVSYTNFMGQVLLKRTYDDAKTLDTYYVYDQYGNLTYVIPPKAAVNIINYPVIQNNRPAKKQHKKAASTGNPILVGTVDEEVLHQLCYIYHYDHRNRMIEKKVPDKGWQYMVYDRLDRVVATQDANMHRRNIWLFTRYDAFNRPVYTGKMTFEDLPSPGYIVSRKEVQQFYDRARYLNESKRDQSLNLGGTVLFYTNRAKPELGNSGYTLAYTLFTVTYYDGYDQPHWLGNTWPSDPAFLPNNLSYTTTVKGLKTGQKTRILGTHSWIRTVWYYDKKGRVIYTGEKNDLNTRHYTYSQLNFLGQPVKTKIKQVHGTQAVTVKDEFTYDRMQRLLSQTRTINGGTPHRLFWNTYNELGQLTHKNLGGVRIGGSGNLDLFSHPLQKADYRYNIRGWLRGINDPDQLGDDLFALQLNYELTEDFSPFGNYATPLYNGNISQAHWKTANDDSGVSRAYTYQYDALNRIKSAAYHRMPGIPVLGTLSYSLGPVSYDRNGNITALKRRGFTNDNSPLGAPPMDDLSYHYRPHSNRLQKVTDAGNVQYGFKDGNTTGNDYAYDANGNLTKDLNKHITDITYNVLNLPKKITITGNNGGTIRFYYTATGQKVRKTVQNNAGTTTTLYDHGFIYKDGELQFFPQPEGYIKANDNGGFTYVFQYKDQLGNIRLSYKNTHNGTIFNPDVAVVEAHDYYPFGLEHKGYNETPNIDAYPYQFNGKELEDALGLDWYDYGVRWYDAAVGRWLGVDPLAGKLPTWSPYSFSFDNPVHFVDFNGAWPWPVHVISFIFSKTVAGGLFLGDARSASFKGTARVRSIFTVNPSNQYVNQPVSKSDPSVFFGAGPPTGISYYIFPPEVKRGTPQSSIYNISYTQNSIRFNFSHSGEDPITPSLLTPELDVNASLSFKENMKKGVLSITGSFTGDKFPSTEAYITDQSGANLLIGAHKEEGGILNLFGENNNKLFNINMQVMFNDNGNFTGVRQGNEVYTVKEWNSKVRNTFGL